MTDRLHEIELASGSAYIWTDEQGLPCAMFDKPNQQAISWEDLRQVFTCAKTAGLRVQIGRPLTVYGTHTGVSETDTFKFVQLDERGLYELLTKTLGWSYGVKYANPTFTYSPS